MLNLLLALLATNPSTPLPATVQPDAAANAWMGPATGAFMGSVAGAVVCGAGTTYLVTSPEWKNTENAPFAMISICSLLIPTSLGGAFLGAAASGAVVEDALLGAGLGLLGGVFGGAALASAIVHAMGPPDANESVVVGVAMLAGMAAGPPIGAALATRSPAAE